LERRRTGGDRLVLFVVDGLGGDVAGVIEVEPFVA
jgi:hypothetical protein